MKKLVRRMGIAVAAIAALAAVVVLGAFAYVNWAWDRPIPRTPPRGLVAGSDPQRVARGKYLFEDTALCWGCHGSKGSTRSDEPQAGGKVFDLSGIGPGFGVYYGSNLTPDPETGLGAWSDDEIVRVMREGVDPTGRLVFPLMPYEWYHGMGDDDALALVAYLRSLPPVHNQVPAARPSFPAKAMTAFGVLKPPVPITAPLVAPPEGITVEYGRYLASRVSGCSECHTPRDPSNGAFDLGREMGGGLFPFPEEGFSATGSNLTPDPATGLGRWTDGQFLTAMRTGQRPDGTVLVPFMPWASYAHWKDGDLRAVWAYLKSLKPVEHRIARPTLTGSAATGVGRDRGRSLFQVYCQGCHGENGESSPLTSIAIREFAASETEAVLAEYVTDGPGAPAMPGFGKTLKPEQIADLVAYLRSMSK